MNRRYTEKDIARLDRGDLTDPAVCSELLRAYCRNDRTTDERLTLKRDLDVFVPEEDFDSCWHTWKQSRTRAQKHAQTGYIS